MQQKNETFRDFLRRTDALSVKIGCDIQQLPEKLGFSRASLFAYRSGTRPITGKAWRKLEAAEREAGMSQIQNMGDVISLEQRQQRGEYLSISEEADLARVREEVLGSVSEEVLNEIRRNYKLFRAWIAAQGTDISDADLDLPLPELVKKLQEGKPPKKP